MCLYIYIYIITFSSRLVCCGQRVTVPMAHCINVQPPSSSSSARLYLLIPASITIVSKANRCEAVACRGWGVTAVNLLEKFIVTRGSATGGSEVTTVITV